MVDADKTVESNAYDKWFAWMARYLSNRTGKSPVSVDDFLLSEIKQQHPTFSATHNDLTKGNEKRVSLKHFTN